MNEIQTGGGASIGRDVGAGRDLVGRDQQRNSVTVNASNEDKFEEWRVRELERRVADLEHDARTNARQYLFAIILFVLVLASLWIGIWYLSGKIDNFTKAAQNLSRVAAEQRK